MKASWTDLRLPAWATLRSDAVAGIPGAIAGVPDGMAASVLAGVNPIHGLYASFAGPIVGGGAASTQLMVITTTGAAALAAGGAVASLAPADRPDALFLLTLLAGAAMIVAGVARLGRYTRFVSHSVMVGFLSGVAVNIVLGQIPDLTGTDASGAIAVEKAASVLRHPGQIDLPTLLTGLAAMAIVVLLRNTRLSKVGAVLALIVPTAIASVLDAGVATVAGDGAIPTGIPLPSVPNLRLFSIDLLLGALSVAVIVLVQGAGVSESAPNLDGTRTRQNRDFIAQGLGNVASGLFQGQPVGGSVGRTALNVATGARSRWATIASGVWMIAILIAFSGLIGKVAMATLAGLLIVAAVGSLRTGEMRTILRTSATSRIVLLTTFVATLVLPIPAAVGLGVALSLLLQLNQDAMDLTVVELTPTDDGRFEERPAPASLPDRHITVLDVYGSLLYAGAKTLERRLPDPSGADTPVVVLRLRGRTTLGATFFTVADEYAGRLHARGGRLYLSGVSHELATQMRAARVVDRGPGLEIVEATPLLGESSLEAYQRANAWLAGR
jgi:SulP family sulfate permease